MRGVQKYLRVGDAVFRGYGRIVNLRNTDVENSVTSTHHERAFLADGIRETCPRSDIVGLKRNLPGGRKERILKQTSRGKGLQVPAHAEIDGQTVGHADRILGKGGILVRIGARSGAAEVLQIIMRYLMGKRPQRRQRQTLLLGHITVRIYFQQIEKKFTALLAGKEIVDPGEQGVAAKLPGISFRVEAQGFSKVQLMFAGLPRQQVGP